MPSVLGGFQNCVLVQFLLAGLNQDPLGRYLSSPPVLIDLCFKA